MADSLERLVEATPPWDANPRLMPCARGVLFACRLADSLGGPHSAPSAGPDCAGPELTGTARDLDLDFRPFCALSWPGDGPTPTTPVR
jgi:hypothetical protein